MSFFESSHMCIRLLHSFYKPVFINLWDSIAKKSKSLPDLLKTQVSKQLWQYSTELQSGVYCSLWQHIYQNWNDTISIWIEMLPTLLGGYSYVRRWTEACNKESEQKTKEGWWNLRICSHYIYIYIPLI